MTTAETAIAPLVKTTTVPQDPAAAFRLFTEHIAAWWPLVTHSVGAEKATAIAFGSAVGERIVETINHDETSIWGTITLWEPPSRVAFTWHPGWDAEKATSVEVAFSATDSGTLVTLTHVGWEHHPGGVKMRADYDSGWDLVLGRYVAAAE